MEIHQVPQLPSLLQLLLVGAVDELPGEVDPVAQVVTETCVMRHKTNVIKMPVTCHWTSYILSQRYL